MYFSIAYGVGRHQPVLLSSRVSPAHRRHASADVVLFSSLLSNNFLLDGAQVNFQFFPVVRLRMVVEDPFQSVSDGMIALESGRTQLPKKRQVEIEHIRNCGT